MTFGNQLERKFGGFVCHTILINLWTEEIKNKVRDILTEAYEERFQKEFISCGIRFECLCQQCTRQNGADDERVAPIK